MTIKKQTDEFARFEWKRNRGTRLGDIFERKYWVTEFGEYDVSSLVGKPHTREEIKRVFDNVYRRLVPCSVYGKLYGFMRGEPAYSGTRIYKMALNTRVNKVRNVKGKDGLNYFIIGGIMFILMTQEEYYVNLKEDFGNSRKYHDSGFRKYLMSHPKDKDGNERLEREREEAVKRWKAEAEVGLSGVDMAYHGDEWDYFFTEVFPIWENKVEADTVGMWCASAGYYANAGGDAIKKMRILVGDLWKEYRTWCRGERYEPLYVKQFSIRMCSAGFLKRFSGGRSFDVFVGSQADMAEWEQKKQERVAAERAKMAEMRGAMREKRDDAEFLAGLNPGRCRAELLFEMYEDWCRKYGQQLSYGKRNFYKWCCENGWKRETKSGTLWMEKK